MATFATFIGIDRHAASDIRDLTGARHDATALHCLIRDSMTDAQATLLCDEEATVSAIRGAIAGSCDHSTTAPVLRSLGPSAGTLAEAATRQAAATINGASTPAARLHVSWSMSRLVLSKSTARGGPALRAAAQRFSSRYRNQSGNQSPLPELLLPPVAAHPVRGLILRRA
jgi:hypothetical protein